MKYIKKKRLRANKSRGRFTNNEINRLKEAHAPGNSVTSKDLAMV